MWEIAENLHRAELTALERSEHIAEWIRLAEQKRRDDVSSQTETVSSKGGRGNKGGVNAASRELGIEHSEAHLAVRRTEKIAPEVHEIVREDLPQVADTGVELDALAKLPVEQQREAVALVERGEDHGNAYFAFMPPRYAGWRMIGSASPLLTDRRLRAVQGSR